MRTGGPPTGDETPGAPTVPPDRIGSTDAADDAPTLADVGERMFDSRSDHDRDAIATERACALAEMILDEVARAHHDWHAISVMARTLSRLSASMTPRHGGAERRP